MQTCNPMQLYQFINELKRKGIYQTLLGVGAISINLNNHYLIYNAYVEELACESRKTQAAYNVAIAFKTTERSVYRAIDKMKSEVDTIQELVLST